MKKHQQNIDWYEMNLWEGESFDVWGVVTYVIHSV